MIHKLGFDGQCDECNAPVYADEVDEEGVCEECRNKFIKQQYTNLKPLYDAEVAAGIHIPT